MEQLEQAGDVRNFCATVMPDHVHWLFQLGQRLSIGRVIARLKASTRKALTSTRIAWQRDFFERQVRTGERLEDYGLYIFLNPYRKGLSPLDESWPYWRMWRPNVFEFSAKMRDGGLPQKEWLAQNHRLPCLMKNRAQQDCARFPHNLPFRFQFAHGTPSKEKRSRPHRARLAVHAHTAPAGRSRARFSRFGPARYL